MLVVLNATAYAGFSLRDSIVVPEVIELEGKKYVLYTEEEDILILKTMTEVKYLRRETAVLDSTIVYMDSIIRDLKHVIELDSVKFSFTDKIEELKNQEIEFLKKENKKLKRRNTVFSIILGVLTLGVGYLIIKP